MLVFDLSSITKILATMPLVIQEYETGNLSLNTRLNQLFPKKKLADKGEITLKEMLSKTPNAEVVWCQEEPKNMGAWFFVDRRIEQVLVDIKAKLTRPTYAGRLEAASPATGSFSRHNKEQNDLVNDALELTTKKASRHAAE